MPALPLFAVELNRIVPRGDAMRDADSRLIEAIVGALLAAALLLAAFAVVAQEPAATNGLTARATAQASAPAKPDMATAPPAVDMTIRGRRIRAGSRDLSGRPVSGDDFPCEEAPRRFTAADEDEGRNADPAVSDNDLSEAEHSPLDACPQREDASRLDIRIAGITAPNIPAPLPDPAPVLAASTLAAVEITPSGSVDRGGGGCVVARDGAPDLVLPLLALWAASRLVLRSRATHGPRRTPRA